MREFDLGWFGHGDSMSIEDLVGVYERNIKKSMTEIVSKALEGTVFEDIPWAIEMFRDHCNSEFLEKYKDLPDYKVVQERLVESFKISLDIETGGMPGI